ncbi:glucose 1-dehydrogenase [Ferribacterium limneticum]|uniref:glucose 1-dehydrogenase n=1 Tax=Ferribacterium limneticum TaxID=76259 RepID=UPI001CFAC977|nr:glucose 1-dehydrogenase [Ferribacterium limneticum]UCV17829.1 SDR family oxidoreductase [Ferribacterium limneticum]
MFFLLAMIKVHKKITLETSMGQIGQVLKDKVVIATGAATGIGRTAALMFAQAGAKVVVADMNSDAGETTAQSIRKAGGESIFIATDVSDETSVAELVRRTVETFGKLDCAFNNAGIEMGQKPLHEIPLSQWQRVMNVDLTGVFLCMKYQIPAMLATGGGSIVNTASNLGMVAIPNGSEYIAAKHGVIGLTKAAAIEYAEQGVRINALLPGVTKTPMIARLMEDPAASQMFEAIRKAHPIGRFATPEEIAQGAIWLLSDASSFVVATSLLVDGGYVAM